MKFLLLIVFGVVAALAKESQVLTDFAAENVRYIGELYKELVKTHPDNFLVSPLSIQTIFALISGGAKGNTAEQITNGLHLPKSEDKMREIFQYLSKTLQTNDQYTLSTANKVYLANNFNISGQFKNTAVDIFHSEIDSVDFGKPRQAAAEINKWVEEKTHNKIQNLVKEETLSQDTAAVMINALYFQGTWVKEFGELPEFPFSINRKKFVFTNMMVISDDFNISRSLELKARFLELPYKGDEVTMTIVLPDTIEGLAFLEEHIAEVLVAPKYQLERVDAVIPKFKIETTTPFIPILRTMGITDAFTQRANFSGIGENQEPLFISQVIQKAFIEVDEKGTTAAAATDVSFDRISGGDLRFVADHPFMFYLKHRVHGIFFIGRYSVPEEV